MSGVLEKRRTASDGIDAMLYYLTFLATGAVLVVLVLGILNLARNPQTSGTTADGKTTQTNMSQQLMRWRIILQLVAVVVLMLALYASR